MRATVSPGSREAPHREAVGQGETDTAAKPLELKGGPAGRRRRFDHVALHRGRREGERRRDYEARLATALEQERRRVAADLHDLVLQDLALALANARMLEPGSRKGDPTVVIAAGERALAGARAMLDGLLATERAPIMEALGSSVRTAARRVPLHFEAESVPSGALVDAATFDALIHIAREAVTNAVKHARPSAIEVRLEREDEWRLSVRDDGHGFEPAELDGGFGLKSMREHARALGGSMVVISAPGAGTVVEALIP